MKPTGGGEDHVPVDQEIVAPTIDDPIARQASGAIGGPLGRHARIGANWWTPLRVALAVVIVVAALGIARDEAFPGRRTAALPTGRRRTRSFMRTRATSAYRTCTGCAVSRSARSRTSPQA